MATPKQLKAFARAGKRTDDEGADEPAVAPVQHAVDENGDRHASPSEMLALVEQAQRQIQTAPEAALVAELAAFDPDEGSCPVGFDETTWEGAEHLVEKAKAGNDPLLIATVYRLMDGPLPAEEDGGEEPGPDADLDDSDGDIE